ncbi:hypothetical protein GCM10009613_09650 [Pseudonocardia kongjuensis]|uniref:Tripartite tricarboxylate transporter TctB family protein n=1 Tax=Pseudonocardia kongjuensis TaxID=102227 RepID=A0ABN1XIP0_9PSEU
MTDMTETGGRARPAGLLPRLLRELAPDAVVLAIAGYALRTSSGWPSQAALFPRYISMVVIGLVAIRVVVVLVTELRRRPAGTADAAGAAGGPGGSGGAGGAGDPGRAPDGAVAAEDAGPDPSATVMDVQLDLAGQGRQVGLLVLVLALFGAAVLGLGYVVGTAVACLVYVRFIARDSWLTALVTTAALTAMVWGLIEFFNLDFRVGLFF